mgnify:CR=1 FL=1
MRLPIPPQAPMTYHIVLLLALLELLTSHLQLTT